MTASTALRPALWRIPKPGMGALLVCLRNLIVWRSYWAASAVGNVGEPLLMLVALGFGLGKFVPDIMGVSYAQFIAPGMAVGAAMYTSSFEALFGSFTRMTTQKTYDAIIATPITTPEVAAGDILFAGIKGALSSASVAIVTSLFGLLPAPWLNIPVLTVLGFVTGLAYGATAMIISALSPSYEFFNYYMTLGLTPMHLFSGIFFPLEEFPPEIAQWAWISPLTHAVAVARHAVWGHVSVVDLGHVALLLACTWIAYIPAANLITRRLIK